MHNLSWGNTLCSSNGWYLCCVEPVNNQTAADVPKDNPSDTTGTTTDAKAVATGDQTAVDDNDSKQQQQTEVR